MSNNLDYSTNTLQKQLEQLRKDWNTYIAGVKAKEKANYFIHFLDKNDILTQEEIGRVVGISKQRVGQIIQQINRRKGGDLS